MHELLLEVDVSEVQTHCLGAAQAGRVHELDERAVPQRDGAVALERLERALDLGRGRRIGEPARPPRSEPRIGHALRSERVLEEGADRGQLAADRGGGELPPAPPAEPGDIVGEDSHVDGVELRPVLLEPAAKLLDVAAVGAPSGLTQRWCGQKTISCLTRVHEGRFGGRRRIPFR